MLRVSGVKVFTALEVEGAYLGVGWHRLFLSASKKTNERSWKNPRVRPDGRAGKTRFAETRAFSHAFARESLIF